MIAQKKQRCDFVERQTRKHFLAATVDTSRSFGSEPRCRVLAQSLYESARGGYSIHVEARNFESLFGYDFPKHLRGLGKTPHVPATSFLWRRICLKNRPVRGFRRMPCWSCSLVIFLGIHRTSPVAAAWKHHENRPPTNILRDHLSEATPLYLWHGRSRAPG